jgi:hypothetical protein
MSTPQTTSDVTSDAGARRRRIRSTTLWLTAFAILVYVGFIFAFVHRQ